MGVVRVLRGLGLRRVEAAPRDGAIDAAALTVPDGIVVIADRQLRDPVALVGQLRADPRTRESPLLVRLSIGGRATGDALLMAGADRVLSDGPDWSLLASALLHLADIAVERRAVRDLRRRLAPIAAPTLAHVADALQLMAVPLFGVDPSGRCTAMNDALVAATGFSRGDVIGRPIWDIVAPGGGRDLRSSWPTFVLVGSLHGRCALQRKAQPATSAVIYMSAHVTRDVHAAAICLEAPASAR